MLTPPQPFSPHGAVFSSVSAEADIADERSLVSQLTLESFRYL